MKQVVCVSRRSLIPGGNCLDNSLITVCAFHAGVFTFHRKLCKQAEGLIAGNIWSPVSVADALDSMTDGMWIRFHITPDAMDRRQGLRILAMFLATIFPSQAARILRRAETAD